MTRRREPTPESVPYHPATLEQHRARYPAAVARTYRVDELLDGAVTPGLMLTHVFDFPDGLRLIVTREDHGYGQVWVHGSASFKPGSALDRRARAGVLSLDGFALLALARLRGLSGLGGRAEFDVSCGSNIPHWYLPCPGTADGGGDGAA